MSRPFIKFIECDCCGQRREQTVNNPRWLPDLWSEVDTVIPSGSKTRHYCGGCTLTIEEAVEKHKQKMEAVKSATAALVDSLYPET